MWCCQNPGNSPPRLGDISSAERLPYENVIRQSLNRTRSMESAATECTKGRGGPGYPYTINDAPGRVSGLLRHRDSYTNADYKD